MTDKITPPAPQQKIMLSGSCSLSFERWEHLPEPDVSLEYTEHSSDHWHSDRETSVTINEETARQMVALLCAAYPALATPAPAPDYAALEAEHLGCPDKRTGVYATAPAPATDKEPLLAHQRTAPARIWLHDGDDAHTEPFPEGNADGVTWSSDNATGSGVPYVREDLATHQPGLQDAQSPAVPSEVDRLNSERLDLACLVLRLIRRMRAARAGEGMAAGDDAFEQQARGYLQRKGLSANPLRDGGDEEIECSVARDDDWQETIIGHSAERGGWCVYSHSSGGEYTAEMGPFGTREEAEAAMRAPQAPQQAECPECIEQARLLGMGAEREAALMAEVERITRICTAVHDGLLRGDDDRDPIALDDHFPDAGQMVTGSKPDQETAELTDEQIVDVLGRVREPITSGNVWFVFARSVIAADRAIRYSGMTDPKADIAVELAAQYAAELEQLRFAARLVAESTPEMLLVAVDILRDRLGLPQGPLPFEED